MQDLYLALVIMGVISLTCCGLTLRLTRNLSTATCDALALLTVGLLAVHIFWMRDTVWWTQWFPYSSLVVLSNWVSPGAGILAALTWRRLEGTAGRMRRMTAFSLLLLVAGYATVSPLMGHTAEQMSQTGHWEQGVCLQSTNYTCSPAAAATLLNHYGIETTEREMADLCLTREGTTWQGLYRGLKLKTEHTPYDVEVFDRKTLADLERLSAEPLLLCVELKRSAAASHYYTRELGWIPGQPHSVVLFGYANSQLLDVGDPTHGRERWSKDDMQTLWHGQGLRLVRRDTSSPDFQLAANR